MKLNPESRYSDAFIAPERIDTSLDRALLDIESVVARVCCETAAEPSEDYVRRAALAVPGGLLANVLFSPDLKYEEERVRLRKIQRLGPRTTR